MLEKIQQGNDAIREKMAALQSYLVRKDIPDQEELARARWELSAVMIKNMAFEDHQVYNLMLTHENPEVSEPAHKFVADMEEKARDMAGHAAKWTPDAIAADWQGYRVSTIRFLQWIDLHMKREETIIFPLLRRHHLVQENTPASKRNWAQNAFELKDNIRKGISAD